MKKFLVILMSLSMLLLSVPMVAQAKTATQLQQELDAAKKQAELIKQQKAQKEKDAATIASLIKRIDGDIKSTQSSLQSTSQKLVNVANDITTTSEQLTKSEARMAELKLQIEQLISEQYQQYITKSDVIAAFSGATLKESIEIADYQASLDSELEKIAADEEITRNKIRDTRTNLEQQQSQLQGLKEQQVAQKNNLESEQQKKNKALTDTKGTIADLAQDEAEVAKKIKEVQAQITALANTKRWGGQIISDNDSSWYFSQLDYPNNKLGNSRYTIAQYGCLITSLGMIATFYGSRNDPPTAVSNSSFNSAGYLLSTNIVNDGGSQAVNWDYIDLELSKDHPVIVGVYLSSIGSLNSYGVSHFIVIKGKNSAGKYLMHDPIGAGRGYDLSQVKAMRIIRPN
jgi:hypothetical protein